MEVAKSKGHICFIRDITSGDIHELFEYFDYGEALVANAYVMNSFLDPLGMPPNSNGYRQGRFETRLDLLDNWLARVIAKGIFEKLEFK